MKKSEKYFIAFAVAIGIASIEIIIRVFFCDITELDFYVVVAFIGLTLFGGRLILDYSEIEFRSELVDTITLIKHKLATIKEGHNEQ